MNKDEFEAWKDTKSKGFLKYIAVNGLLMWGLPMFVAMAFISKPFTDGFTSKSAIVHYIVWPFAGLLYGAMMWWVNERRFKKFLSSKKN